MNTELTAKEQKITASMDNLMVDNPAPNATVKKVCAGVCVQCVCVCVCVCVYVCTLHVALALDVCVWVGWACTNYELRTY